MAFSSASSELLVERLARRIKEADGDVPDRPRVVMESLRRCSLMAADVPGKLGGWPCVMELLRKRLAKAADEAVTEPRLCWRAISLLV